MCAALQAGSARGECSLDLGRSMTTAVLSVDGWMWQGRLFPYLDRCNDRPIYSWAGEMFSQVSRFTTSLFKLVPTTWGLPTLVIVGIMMVPTAQCSTYIEAERKLAVIAPRGI